MVGDPELTEGIASVFRALENGRYEPVDCPDGRCRRVRLAEIPYERQIDETDHQYAYRLRVRASAATDVGNHAELMAILGALQNDIGIPEGGIAVPCDTLDDWEAFAFVQGVTVESWTFAQRAGLPVSEDVWFAGRAYDDNLQRALRDKLSDGSSAGWVPYQFIGPDGLLYWVNQYAEDQSAADGAIELPANNLRSLYLQLSTGMGMVIAGADPLPTATQFANLETLEPPLYGVQSILFEFETEAAPSEADHGENIILAQYDPRPGFPQITGPLGRPTSRPRVTIGVSPHQPRPTARIAANRNRAPLPQWLLARFARGRANERRVLQDRGLTKNTRTVEGRDRDGSVIRTVPDAMPTGRMIEVKDVRMLAHTRQIRGQMSAARAEGRTYEIIVGPGTTLTPTMQRLQSRGRVVITRHPALGHGDP